MSAELCTTLNNHAVFKKLKQHMKTKDQIKSLRLFTYKNDIVYIWNNHNKSLDSVDIKEVVKKGKDVDFLSLVPKPSLYFDVENVYINSTSTIVCFYGSNGVSVCKLPDRWLLKDDNVELTSDFLAQRVFICDHHVLRCVSWHPGSPSDSHLVILTSDEVLRLYNVLDCSLVWEIRLSERLIRRNLPNKASIGETPVCFDFGSSERSNTGAVVWPIYILWGNGDTFKIDTQIEDFNYKIEGPLRFEPSVEDNYGPDASSIVVLDSNPPLVAIATCGGIIHHCLVFPEDNEQVLHVVETIELELGIVDNSQQEEDIISCPIRLDKDPNQTSRYFCFHDSGIHSVNVSLVDKLMKLDDDLPSFDSERIDSTTDYLLCTGLNSEIPNSPTLGIAYIDLTKIIVLLSNGELIKLPIFNRCESPLNITQFKNITMDKSDDFKSIIETILKENGVSTFPLVKLPKEGVKTADLFKIVNRATGSLRSVLKCHSDVILKIQQKSDSLRSHLTRQSESMEKLNDDRSSLRSTAEQIAERYEEINDRQNELIQRTERLLLKIECDGQRTSANEKRMSELLERAKSKMKQLESDISAVQSFYSRLEQSDTKQNEEKELHCGNKVQMLYKSMKHLNKDVSELTGRVKSAKEIVSRCQFHNV